MENKKNLRTRRIEIARQEGLGGRPVRPKILHTNEKRTHAKITHKKNQFPDLKKIMYVYGIWEAKIDPNRIQNKFKFKTMVKTEKVALGKPLGGVLGSWGLHVGV